MKNYLKGFNELFAVNEMASTLSKLGVPKKLITVIHNLPDKIEKIKPFTYDKGDQRSFEIPPIGQNRPSHSVGVLDHFRMKKTQLLGNMYGSHPAKMPGYLADLEKVPWGDTRILLAVPNPGGKYAGQEPRYDYIYHKASAFGKKEYGGGKKYRILTMDQDGRILRDWAAYQGKLTYPKDPNKRDEPAKFRNDFSDFPTDANGFIDVYILDPETVDYQTEYQKMGPREAPKSHRVPIGKARAQSRERLKTKLVNSDTFIDDFAKRFQSIIASLYGKRKQQAAAAYAQLILQDDADPREINRLQATINTNQDVMNNIAELYKNFLNYLRSKGDYLEAKMDEFGNSVSIYSGNIGRYASLLDILNKHGKDKALRNFAEFILTGDVNDVYTESEIELEPTAGTKRDSEEEFKSMLDYDFDIENPFGDEDISID